MIEQLAGQLSTWLGGVAGPLPLGYAFGAGMVSIVNPCGFAILPAYLGLYLGSSDIATVGRPLGDVRALAQVSLAVTAGFVLLFGGVGLLVSAGGQLIIGLAPWAARGIGLALVALGLAGLLGRHISVGFAARLATRMGDPRTIYEGTKLSWWSGTAAMHVRTTVSSYSVCWGRLSGDTSSSAK